MRKVETTRRINQVTKAIAIVVVLVFVINACIAFISRNEAHAAKGKCPGGRSSFSADKYWADSDSTNNWRLGEVNMKAHACYGSKGKIKSTSAKLYVRTNGVGTALGYEIYRLPGNDYTDNINKGMVKVHYLYAQYHQCLIPIPGAGLICNHTGTVRFEITIFSPRAMKDLGQYAPRKRILWLWTARNDWADNHFEIFNTP